MKIKIEAIHLAESFNIKKFKADFQMEAHSGLTSELYYIFPENNRFLYVFDYGVVVFANYDAVAKSEFVTFIKKYASVPLNLNLTEEYLIETNSEADKSVVKNNYVTVPKINSSLVHVVMLNIAQSVALDYYENLTNDLIFSSKHYLIQLEQEGKIKSSKKNLLKHIGKVMNFKNSIIDNLYILDDPNLVWDNEDLNLLNRHLKLNFEIFTRFKDLDYRLQNVEQNLELLVDVLNVRESSRLEWLIVILIFIEILLSLLLR